MRYILVTGAAGFIGSHLCEHLLKAGEVVVGVDNFDPFYPEEIKRRNIEGFRNHSNFCFYETSILDFENFARIFNDHKLTHVVHLAAKAGVRPSIKDPGAYQKYNVEGTGNALELCRHNGIKKFIFASSSSVYGNNKKVPFSETDNVDYPISPYAATKKAGELLCHTYHHLYQISIYALRFFTVYGPRQRPEMAIHKFTRQIDRNEPIQVYGGGNPKRDFTYISDIIEGVVKAIEKVSGFEIINLGESKTISVSELIDKIESEMNKTARRKQLPMQPGDVDQTYADIKKAQQLLNFNPKIEIESGLSLFVKWYFNNKKYL